jgi:hypothetical protein
MALQRIFFAGVLTLGLAAITLLPIYVNQGYIGGHPNEIRAGTYADLGKVVQQFFTSEELFRTGTVPETYYSYVLPLWFAILIFIVFPPIYPWLHQPANPRQDWRVWLVGIVIVIFFTLWGAGINPIIDWMYSNLPLIGQWRFVSRMLAVSSFWVAVLATMRIDSLWRTIARPGKTFPKTRRLDLLFSERAVSLLLMIVLTTTSLLASWHVIATWTAFGGTGHEDVVTNKCISWLRQQYPTKELSVYSVTYYSIYTYLRHHVRHAHISADYQLHGLPPTILSSSLLDTAPEFFVPNIQYFRDERNYAESLGYQPVNDSPLLASNTPCLWRKSDVLSYAFSAPMSTFKTVADQLSVSSTVPITSLERHPDRIALVVTGIQSEPLVVTVQELAWPGWQVSVDGSPAKLESVGELIGVVLPTGTIPHYIVFQYVPPLFIVGGIITLFTILVCILYLFHADRYIPTVWRERLVTALTGAGRLFKRLLLDPSILTPDD